LKSIAFPMHFRVRVFLLSSIGSNKTLFSRHDFDVC